MIRPYTKTKPEVGPDDDDRIPRSSLTWDELKVKLWEELMEDGLTWEDLIEYDLV